MYHSCTLQRRTTTRVWPSFCWSVARTWMRRTAQAGLPCIPRVNVMQPPLLWPSFVSRSYLGKCKTNRGLRSDNNGEYKISDLPKVTLTVSQYCSVSRQMLTRWTHWGEHRYTSCVRGATQRLWGPSCDNALPLRSTYRLLTVTLTFTAHTVHILLLEYEKKTLLWSYIRVLLLY